MKKHYYLLIASSLILSQLNAADNPEKTEVKHIKRQFEALEINDVRISKIKIDADKHPSKNENDFFQEKIDPYIKINDLRLDKTGIKFDDDVIKNFRFRISFNEKAFSTDESISWLDNNQYIYNRFFLNLDEANSYMSLNKTNESIEGKLINNGHEKFIPKNEVNFLTIYPSYDIFRNDKLLRKCAGLPMIIELGEKKIINSLILNVDSLTYDITKGELSIKGDLSINDQEPREGPKNLAPYRKGYSSRT